MLTRRALLMNAAATAATAPSLSFADTSQPTALKIQRRTIDVNGKAASVYGIMQSNGAHGLITEVGARFRVRVENGLDEPSLIHWHGLTPPSNEDGVPEISGPIIPQGGFVDYDFPLAFGGTYWMHSHYGFQEHYLAAAPLIIREPAKYFGCQEVVVMLADFSFTPPEQIYASLTSHKKKGGSEPMTAHHDMDMSHGMDMGGATMAPDLNDVSYDAFLANDRTLADPEIIKVEDGGRVLLRLVYSASMSAFHVDLGILQGKLVAVDGQDVLPVTGGRFPIATGQRLDILLELPRGTTAFPLLFVLEGERKQTGVILAAPGAEIHKIPQEAQDASPALDLGLESRLRAAWPLAPRKADRVYTLDLTGDMASYVWSINNVVWSESTPPLPLIAGERVELAITNRTMMPHPMHLHGHRFQVVEIDGERFSGAVRDTVLAPPMKKVVVAFDANNPGHWAFHCHLLYHMHAGMFATFRYA